MFINYYTAFVKVFETQQILHHQILTYITCYVQNTFNELELKKSAVTK